jgi:hypothetical protein
MCDVSTYCDSVDRVAHLDAGSGGGVMAWTDSLYYGAGSLATFDDPVTAIEDAKQAHRWATQERDDAASSGNEMRAHWLQEERKRLVGIVAELRRQV